MGVGRSLMGGRDRVVAIVIVDVMVLCRRCLVVRLHRRLRRRHLRRLSRSSVGRVRAARLRAVDDAATMIAAAAMTGVTTVAAAARAGAMRTDLA